MTVFEMQHALPVQQDYTNDYFDVDFVPE